MAFITLNDLYDKWKRVSDWVTGSDTTSKPKVLTGSIVEDAILQNAVSAVGNGTAISVGNLKTLTLEIYGTSTSRTIVFEGASTSGAWYAIQGVKLQDLTTGSQTANKDELWQFDVTGLVSFRSRISAISGGNVTVKGKAVS